MHHVLALVVCGLVFTQYLQADTVTIDSRTFTIPAGFELKLATETGLTERPIVVDIDERGNLFVAESSGTNDNVQQQLREKPHSILRLTDSNNDGVFDRKTVFADRMMFPEGVLCHDGSVYVGAPPEIWKLTDTDDDGVADRREVWFDAKTLTGCANDLHGPYLGLDGWIYWCKGAFAEQTHARPGSSEDPLVTRAAHIFRRRPEGGPVEPVMTGGMDNPVEVVFTATGERIFTTTFFQHPANGQRDGLVHAIYGGVYGKPHGVIEGHPRTGELMPVLTQLGAAAPSGLARLQSRSLGFQNQLLTACFNLHSVTRHELISHGATFKTKDVDLVATDDLDFHPTDVIEDADGSILIVDTGGWYKLCCPTSQLHKPDIAGHIYRLSKRVTPPTTAIANPRGLQLNWSKMKPRELVEALNDQRFAVRNRAVSELRKNGTASLPALSQLLKGESAKPDSADARLLAVWSACRIDGDDARATVRIGLTDTSADVRQAAAHAVSVWRDRTAEADLIRLLGDPAMAVRRVAAEALGRIRSERAIPALLSLIDSDIDRVLEHSAIYALIETNAAEPLQPVLRSPRPKQQLAAVLAIHGMRDGQFSQGTLCELLDAEDKAVRILATKIAVDYPQWSESYVEVLRRRLAGGLARDNGTPDLAQQLATLADQPAVSQFIASLLPSASTPKELKLSLLQDVTLPNGRLLDGTLNHFLASDDQPLVDATVRNLYRRKHGELSKTHLAALARVAKSSSANDETRLLAAQCLPALDDELFDKLLGMLSSQRPAKTRSLAVSAMSKPKLTQSQLLTLADQVRTVGPLELSRLLDLFESQSDEQQGITLFTSLAASPYASALPAERIAKLATQFGSKTEQLAKPLLATATVDPAAQAIYLDKLVASLPQGEIRRGQRIFHNEKLACFTCHAVGYRGGKIGPDLSRIGATRSRRDLLEAIVYPSASFVRSYEPINVLTTDGRQVSGTIQDQSAKTLVLRRNATETVTIAAEDIDEMLPGSVSIMPDGMEKQLSKQELADLLAFLMSRR